VSSGPGVRAYQMWNIVAAAVVLAVLGASLAMMQREVFWSPDEGGKFFALASVRWDGGLAYGLPYHGRAVDPELRFAPRGPGEANEPPEAFPYPREGADGRIQWHWPPWFPLASRPLFAAFGVSGVYLLPLLSGWLIALASGWIAHALAPRLAAPAMLVVGLATPVWFYSLTFWEHTLAAAAGVLAIAFLVHGAPRSRRTLLAMLPPLLMAALLRIEMLAFGVTAVLAWALRDAVETVQPTARRHAGSAVAPSAAHVANMTRAGTESLFDTGERTGGAPARQDGRTAWRPWLAAGLAVGLIALLWLAAASWLAPRQSVFFTAIPAHAADALTNLSNLPRAAVGLLVNSAVDEGPVVPAAWTAAAAVALAACFVAPFLRAVWLEACVLVPGLAGLLTFSLTLAALEPSYRSLHAFFPIAPFTAFWLFAWRDARGGARRDTLVRAAALYFVAGSAVLFAYRIDLHGHVVSGLEWGSRYLLALYPLLAILALAAVDGYVRSPRPAWLRGTVGGLMACLIAAAVLLESRGVAVLAGNHALFATWNRVLRDDDRIVTDVWWLPATLAPLFVAKETYFVRRRAEVSEWAALAAAHGEREFTFAAFGPVRDDELGPGVRRIPQRCTTVSGLQVLRFAIVDAPPAP